MIYYGIAAIFPLIMWFINDYVARVNRLDEQKKKKLTHQLTIVAILPMFLLFVLRYKYIGSDTIGYVRFFQKEIRSYSWLEVFSKDTMRFEIGFRVYTKIISLFSDSYTFYFLINALVIFGILMRFSFKYTENPFVFFFLFITLGTYAFFETGLRQALAMVICLLAVDCVKNKKLIPFILIVLLAYYFHKSALIFLIIYPLSSIKKYDWIIFVYAILAVVFVLGFTAFQGFFNEWVGFGYEEYVNDKGGGGIFLLLIFILYAFSFYVLYDKKGEDKTPHYIIHLALTTIIFWLLRLISRTAERISYYYIFGLYIYFSQAIKYDKDRLSSLLKWLLILACLVLFIYRNIGINYQFIWQGA